jgi:hypothetical protein
LPVIAIPLLQGYSKAEIAASLTTSPYWISRSVDELAAELAQLRSYI